MSTTSPIPAPQSSEAPTSSGSPDARTKIALALAGAALLLIFLAVLGCYLRHPPPPVAQNGDWRFYIQGYRETQRSASESSRRGRSASDHPVTLGVLDSQFPERRYQDCQPQHQTLGTDSASSPNETGASCCICLEQFDDEDFVRILECRHVFHSACARS